MERLDKRAPFTATGGIIPPEFEHIKTPCYILDEKALIENAKLLGGVAERTGCKMLLAQKAFSNYDCYPFFEPYLAGTEASGLYEARLGAEEMPGKEVHVFCAGYRADEFEELLQYADHIVFNSPSQLLRFGRMAKEAGKSVGLRINPECSTQEGHEIYDPCAPGSRMGTTRVQWDEAIVKNPELMELLDGVHFHTLCEQDSDDLETTLDSVKKQFGDLITKVKWINFGGGHHITRPGYDIGRLGAMHSNGTGRVEGRSLSRTGRSMGIECRISSDQCAGCFEKWRHTDCNRRCQRRLPYAGCTGNALSSTASWCSGRDNRKRGYSPTWGANLPVRGYHWRL